jgi:hypothetical protein
MKEIVRDNTVHFLRYRKGHFFYEVMVGSATYSFPVPLDDIGGATLERIDSALMFMRWIRRALDDGTFTREV